MKNKQFLRDVKAAERPDVGHEIYQLVLLMDRVEGEPIDYKIIQGLENRSMNLVEIYNKVGDLDEDMQKLILFKERHNDAGYKKQVKTMLTTLSQGYYHDMRHQPTGEPGENLIRSLEESGYHHPASLREYHAAKEELKAAKGISQSLHTMLHSPKIRFPRMESDAELEEVKKILATLSDKIEENIKSDPRFAAAWKKIDENYRATHHPQDNILESIERIGDSMGEIHIMEKKG